MALLNAPDIQAREQAQGRHDDSYPWFIDCSDADKPAEKGGKCAAVAGNPALRSLLNADIEEDGAVGGRF